MKQNDFILIILFAGALAFEVWILHQVGKHSQAKREQIEKNIIIPISDQELDSIECDPVIDTRAYFVDGDTLATENI